MSVKKDCPPLSKRDLFGALAAVAALFPAADAAVSDWESREAVLLAVPLARLVLASLPAASELRRLDLASLIAFRPPPAPDLRAACASKMARSLRWAASRARLRAASSPRRSASPGSTLES